MSMCRNTYRAETCMCRNVPVMKCLCLNVSGQNVRCQNGGKPVYYYSLLITSNVQGVPKLCYIHRCTFQLDDNTMIYTNMVIWTISKTEKSFSPIKLTKTPILPNFQVLNDFLGYNYKFYHSKMEKYCLGFFGDRFYRGNEKKIFYTYSRAIGTMHFDTP